MHYLDLPNIQLQPSYSTLAGVLLELEPAETKDFEAVEGLDKGTRQWLSRLACSDLKWIENEDKAEEVRALASRRLAMECGATANSVRVRKVDLGNNIVVELMEPGITEDNLGRLTWGSSLILSRRLVRQPELVKNKKIIELGAGTGLCGISASLVGAYSVDVTDLPEIVPNLAQNVAKNNASCNTYVLDWTDPEVSSQFDVCIISDPVYSREHPAFLLQAIEAVSAPVILLQLPLRKGFENERQHIYDGLKYQGYLQADTEQESGRDVFGDQNYAYFKYFRA